MKAFCPESTFAFFRKKFKSNSNQIYNGRLSREGTINQSVNLDLVRVAFLLQKKMISEVEPVDDVEDEKEEGHGDEEESVNVNVVLAADPLVPGQLHLAQSCVVQPVYDLAHAL